MTALQAIAANLGTPAAVIVPVADPGALHAFADAIERGVQEMDGRYFVTVEVSGVPAVFWAPVSA